MPLMFVTLTPGAYDGEHRDRLAEMLTEASTRAESIPNLPGPRSRAVVCIDELQSGRFYSAGKPAAPEVRGVFMTLYASAGVLDAARKAKLAADLQKAAEDASASAQGRVVTSVVIVEVPEGQWGQGGHIARLPEVAALAQFEHLKSIATPAAV